MDGFARGIVLGCGDFESIVSRRTVWGPRHETTAGPWKKQHPGVHALIHEERATAGSREPERTKSQFDLSRAAPLFVSRQELSIGRGPRQNRRGSQKNSDDGKVNASTRYTSMRTPPLRFRGKKCPTTCFHRAPLTRQGKPHCPVELGHERRDPLACIPNNSATRTLSRTARKAPQKLAPPETMAIPA